MSNSPLSKYSAKIKDIYIELKDYKFFHSPYYQKEGTGRFIGREKIIRRIVSILKNTKIKSGAYLITGFRGMGKTSVIRESIYEYNSICDKSDDVIEKIWEGITALKRIIIICFFFWFMFYGNTWQNIISDILTPVFFLFNIFNIGTIPIPNTYFARIYLLIPLTVLGILIIIFQLRYWGSLTDSSKFYKKFLKVTNQFIPLIKTTWNAFKIVFILCLILIIGFETYFYESSINTVLDVKNEKVHLFEGFFNLIKDQQTNLRLVQKWEDLSIMRMTLGLVLSYLFLSTLFFINDLLEQSIKILFGISKQSMRKEKDFENYEKFEINLSQESLNEIDFLRRITLEIREYWIENKRNFDTDPFDRKIFFFGHFILSKINKLKKENTQPDYSSVLHKLNTLINRMSGEVITEREKTSTSGFSEISNGIIKVMTPNNSSRYKNGITYPIANSKEVEDYLIEILENIDLIRDSRKECGIRQFVFIIDELDKIQPRSSSVIEERESTNPELDKKTYALDNNKFRQRQEAVATLLANLKGFLNVVRVKFFFIGGREMFDAHLADIADRDSFYSSIFNDVIYVDSFFKDSLDIIPGKGGVTQMTEKYLCNIILNNLNANKKEIHKAHKVINLKTLFKRLVVRKENTLDRLYFHKERENYESKSQIINTEKKRTELDLQAYKAAIILQNYIVYLTYRSNGTPKKLATLTEKIMVNGPSSEDNQQFFEDNIVIRHDGNSGEELSERLFLKFSFDFQYEIGLTSNLYRPYLITNSRHLKSLGDKLLFSSSFIIDHILKFHPFGFSWRNLELIPEVVLVNREPNLRKFIEDLMRFYSSNYMEDTVSGIFDYKFRSIVRRELIYLSKTSDLGSAAFNFTLDESFSTKRHYKKKLIELEKSHLNHSTMSDDNKFIHSISFVQTILGDLHFYDKEYDEAIIFYSESIQSLRLPRAVTSRYITRHQFLLWLRNQLKLGLSLEKIRAFDSAFSLYKTLILDTERYLKKVVSQKGRNEEEGKTVEVSEDHRTIHLISMPFVAFLAVSEKARVDGITYASLLRNRQEFLRVITPSIYEDDIILDRYRRNFLKADYYNNVGSLLFYKNCQFIKFSKRNEEQYHLECFAEDIIEKDFIEFAIFKQQNIIYDKTEANRIYDFFPSLVSLNYYWNSLYFLTETHQERVAGYIQKNTTSGINIDVGIHLENNLLAICAGYLLPECVDMVSNKRLYYIANVISKIGDSILASLKKKHFIIPDEKFDLLDNDMLDGSPGPHRDVQKRLHNIAKFRLLVGQSLYTIETILYTYKLAASLYRRSGHNSYYSSHLIKILYTIKDLIEFNKAEKRFVKKINGFLGIEIKGKNKTNFEVIEKVAEIVFMITSWNNDIANRPQALKYREIFKTLKNKSFDRDVLFNSMSNISDSREVLILVEEIKMRLDKNALKDFSLSKSIISPYTSMSSRYLRMLELKYRSERCYFILKKVLQTPELFNIDFIDEKVTEKKFKNYICIKDIKMNLRTVLKDNHEGVFIKDIIEFLIKEAFFCLGELIKMFKLYDPGYVIGYCFIATAHHRLGDWCLVYENYKKIISQLDSQSDDLKKGIESVLPKSEREKLEKKLKRVIEKEKERPQQDFFEEIKKMAGSEILAYLEYKNHYESAIQYYYKVIQMHSDNKAYADKLHELYMLEDDYNDISAHYIIASERLRVNTGNIKSKITKIRKLMKDKNRSKLYSYKYYFPREKDTNDVGIDYNKIVNYLSFFNEELS